MKHNYSFSSSKCAKLLKTIWAQNKKQNNLYFKINIINYDITIYVPIYTKWLEIISPNNWYPVNITILQEAT
jgi:hypothetical protein